MIVIFLGPPGCGKGTQAHILKEKHGFHHISTGELLRQEVGLKTDLGLEIATKMKSGEMINDHIVFTLLKKTLENNVENRLLLDGFPRTISQVQQLDNYLCSVQQTLSKVFYFDIDHALLIQRIAGRFSCVSCGAIYNDPTHMPKTLGVCDNCQGTHFQKRDDDTVDVVETRIKAYHDVTLPVVQHYRTQGLLMNVNAAQGVDQIRNHISVNLNL